VEGSAARVLDAVLGPEVLEGAAGEAKGGEGCLAMACSVEWAREWSVILLVGRG